MLNGASFEDYLVHKQRDGAEDPNAFFLMTSKVHLPTLHHALRSSYKVVDGQQTPRQSSLTQTCPPHESVDNSTDAWGPYEEMPWLQSFVSGKCGVQEAAIGEAMLMFWDSFVQLPRPPHDIVHYAQGARFAVSRDRIRQRSRAFYKRLLASVGVDSDPCLNYLYEWAWYYILGKPEASPCITTQAEKAQAWAARGRRLAGGISGVSGVSGISGSPLAPSLAPTPVPAEAPTSPAPAPTPGADAAAYIVEGSTLLEVDDSAQACGDAALLLAFRGAKATLAGSKLDAVEAVCRVPDDQSRRLGTRGRRLAGSRVEFDYEITMSSAAAANSLINDIDTESLDELTALIQDNLPEGSPDHSVKVVSKTAPTLLVLTVTTTTTAAGEDVEHSHAHARAGFDYHSFIVVLATVALLLR